MPVYKIRVQRENTITLRKYTRAAILSFVILFLTSLTAEAAILTCDGSQADCQRKVNQSVAGDTVQMPTGTFTWDVQVHINKNITFKGAGQDVTTIVDDVRKLAGGNKVILLFCDNITGNFHITGFTIRGQAQDANKHNKGTIEIYGSSHAVRVDHITFDKPGSGSMQMHDVWGAIDHCYFDGTNSMNGVAVEEDGPDGWGDESFETPIHLGSGEILYIEDNTFVSNGLGGAAAMNSVRDGRVVFRHNNLISQNTRGHGLEGTRNRGMRSFETYQYTFKSTSKIMNKAIQLRGGTGVIWGNRAVGAGGGTKTGYKNFVSAYDFRSINHYNHRNFGWASSSNPWEANTDETG